LTTVVVGAGGSGLRWTWTVPTIGTGVQLFLQAGVLAPNVYNALGITVTNGVCMVLGAQP